MSYLHPFTYTDQWYLLTKNMFSTSEIVYREIVKKYSGAIIYILAVAFGIYWKREFVKIHDIYSNIHGAMPN